MKGTFQKTIEAITLPCHPCRFFRADHPFFYTCVLARDEFPGLCEQYELVLRLVKTQTPWRI